jgi:hypothetical protein
VIEIHEGVRWPEARTQFFAGDYSSARVQQGSEEAKRLFLKANSNAVSSKFAGSEVYFEVSEANY